MPSPNSTTSTTPASAAADRRADLLRMTTSPDGEQVLVHCRLAEIHDRYGSGHLVSRATPLILESVGQVTARAASTS